MRDTTALAPIIDSQYRTEHTYPKLVRVKRTFVDRGVTIEIEGWRARSQASSIERHGQRVLNLAESVRAIAARAEGEE